jgi:hydrogenase nickel incorporation protein HypA/HybF
VHELSIAQALAAQVEKHAPEGARVRGVEIVVGALRGIVPEALQLGWQAATMDSRMAGSTLSIDQRPWTITCPDCGRSWTSPEPFVACECGNPMPEPHGTDELDLVAITVDEGEAVAEEAG